MSENIKYFESPVTKKKVAINLDREEFAWLHVPSPEEFEALLLDHERIRIHDAWQTKFYPQRKGEDWIEAFQPVPEGSLRMFRAEALKQYLGEEKKRGLSHQIRALPVDEQRALLERIKPTSRVGLASIASVIGVREVLGPDFRADFLRDRDPKRFISDIIDTARNHKTARGEYERYTEVLSMLRARGWLLFSVGFTGWYSTTKWRAAENEAYCGPLAGLLHQLSGFLDTRGKDKARSPQLSFAAGAVLMSSISEVSDMSAAWIEEVEARYEDLFAVNLNAAPQQARALGKAFREIWNHHHPEHHIAQKLHRNVMTNDVRRTSGTFEWLKVQYPSVSEWVEPLAAFIRQREAKSQTACISDINYVMTFFGEHPSPPATPEHLIRHIHISDVTRRNDKTLLLHLAKKDTAAKYKNRCLSYLRAFLSWYPDWLHANGLKPQSLGFVTAVTLQDNFIDTSNSRGHTHRTALPSWLLKVMRETLVADDFALFKSSSQDWIRVHDRQEKKVVKTWWPGTATAILTLLELPLRSHQVRWLDSGVLDEKSVDHRTGKLTQNTHINFIPKRNQSCLRYLHDSLRLEKWCGLFVNTNKTAYYDGKSPAGYEIPYLSPELAERLAELRDWGIRYLPPIAKPVTYSDTTEGRIRYPQANPDTLPKVAPLFRDPWSRDTLTPIRYEKLSGAYIRLLAATEVQLKERYDMNVSLTKSNTEGRTTWIYDMHTLRVSGISAMIENGVPLEIVSQFAAGHATLVMTLWYYRNSPGQLREAIRKAQERAASESDFLGSPEFMEELENLSPFLLSKDGDIRGNDGDVAYAALKEHTGLWTISSDGICPGTSCSTGGELENSTNTYGPVPGGRRCGLCRYWITGPAFVLGQMAEANNLIYQIRRKGQELAAARDDFIEYTDAGDKTKAQRVRSRVEALERELTLDLAEWQSRYTYAMKSSELLDSYTQVRETLANDKDLPAPLLTSSSEQDLHLTLQENNEFVLLDHLTQMVDFMPGFKNREAIHEKHLVLSRLLEANGMPQFLLRLAPEEANVASNMLSSLILEYVKAQDLPSVLSGDMKLAEIPALAQGVKELADASELPVVRGTAHRTIPLTVESA